MVLKKRKTASVTQQESKLTHRTRWDTQNIKTAAGWNGELHLT